MLPRPSRPSTPSLSGPIRTHERIRLLDAIRGVALGGILLANLMSFFGTDMMEATTRRAMLWGCAGEGVLFAINWLVEGKFCSIFSMLLGTGFALQAARAEQRGTSPESFDRFFRRRMAVLVAIGLTHMYGLWSGDILALYGIMGLLLPTVARLPVTVRTVAMILLFCVPREGITVVGWTVGELGLAGASTTASRLNLKAIEIPASIDVLDSTVMEARGYQKVSDAVSSMAGVVAGEHPTAPSSFVIRGFTANQVATLRDGIWLGPSTMIMRPQNTFNLDRVELLRGPSSVINGQGAVAGTINAVTKSAEPTSATRWQGLASYGRFNSQPELRPHASHAV